MKNPTILAIAGGFYFFGDEVPSTTPGYVCLKAAAMFGGFGGGKGLPGVSRGDREATVILDRFDEQMTCSFPESAVYGILPSIDLYTFKGTTLR